MSKSLKAFAFTTTSRIALAVASKPPKFGKQKLKKPIYGNFWIIGLGDGEEAWW